MNDALAELESRLVAGFGGPAWPTLFIVGVQRSGTTLLMQLLARHTSVGYVDNLMARFWRAPYLGALLSRPFRGTTGGGVGSFTSRLGLTEGVHGPHEFGYFWRRWFPVGQESHRLDETARAAVDQPLLASEMAAVEAALGAPVVIKNLIHCSFQISVLAEALPKARFVLVERDPAMVAQSTLESRRQLFGSDEAWFGLKPPETTTLRSRPPLEQVAAQAHYSSLWIRRELLSLPRARWMSVSYSAICERPEAVVADICELLKREGAPVEVGADWPVLYQKDEDRLPASELDTIRATLLACATAAPVPSLCP